MSIIIATVFIIIAKRKKNSFKKRRFLCSRKEIYSENEFMKDLILKNVNIFNLEYRYNEFKEFYRISSIELNIY